MPPTANPPPVTHPTPENGIQSRQPRIGGVLASLFPLTPTFLSAVPTNTAEIYPLLTASTLNTIPVCHPHASPPAPHTPGPSEVQTPQQLPVEYSRLNSKPRSRAHRPYRPLALGPQLPRSPGSSPLGCSSPSPPPLLLGVSTQTRQGPS